MTIQTCFSKIIKLQYSIANCESDDSYENVDMCIYIKLPTIKFWEIQLYALWKLENNNSPYSTITVI